MLKHVSMLVLVVSACLDGADASSPFGYDALRGRNMDDKQQALETYAGLPLSFEANQGQAGNGIDFLARGPGYRVFLQPAGAVVAINNGKNGKMTLRMAVVGGNPKARAEGVHRLPGKTNYLMGRDPKAWRTGLSNYARVCYRQMYPGVDLVYYGNQQRLEYDFVVAPGADPGMIKLRFSGMEKITIGKDGRLNLASATGESVFFSAPIVYQEIGGVRKPVDGRYVLGAQTRQDGQDGQDGMCAEVGFAIGEYDRARPLVIDPFLTYALFLGGGNMDELLDIAVDYDHGTVFATGRTDRGFGLPGNQIGTVAGFMNSVNVFVVKMSFDGELILYTTYVGGLGTDSGTCIAIDAQRNAYVAGNTNSTHFPVDGAIEALAGERDGFVFKLNHDGDALLHSTFLGGVGDDDVFDIAVNDTFIAIAGRTDSHDFPHDQQPESKIGAFASLLSAGTGVIAYTRVFGYGSANAVAFDGLGDLYIGGQAEDDTFPVTGGTFQVDKNARADGFIAKLDPIGLGATWFSYLGGSSYDGVKGIAVNSDGDVYATGYTYSVDFPVTDGAYQDALVDSGEFRVDAFVTRVNPSGSGLLFSTYIGGGGADEGNAIVLDQCGNVYVAGFTLDFMDPFPQVNPLPGSGIAGVDAFVFKMNALGTGLLYSTCLGGGSWEVANGIGLDTFGNVYVGGSADSQDFLGVFTTYGGRDGFIASIAPSFNQVGFSDLTFTVGEADGAAVISVTRDGSGSGEVTVAYETRDGRAVRGGGSAMADEDYTAVSGILTWADGDLVNKTITIPIIDDGVDESVEGVDLFLTNPTGGAEIGCAAIATLAIEDDDQPVPECIVEFERAEYNVYEDGSFMEISVVRSGDSSGAAAVSYWTDNGSATNGEDYTLASGDLQWAEGETGVKRFSIEIIDDELSEGDETVNLRLAGACSPADARITAVLNIIDDETEESGIIQFEANAYSVDEDAGTITLTVIRQSGQAGRVTVEFETRQGSASQAEHDADYVLLPRAELTFEEGQTESSITLEILDDTLAETDETFDVVLSNPTGGAVLGTNAVATVSIQDNDQTVHSSSSNGCHKSDYDCGMSDLGGGLSAGNVFFMCLFLGSLALWWGIRRRCAGNE